MGRLRLLVLTLTVALSGPPDACAQSASAQWYLNPYLGGITPDKPWGATGSAALIGLDAGVDLSARWSAELAVDAAPLSDRADSGRSELYGVALAALRVFNRAGSLAPYLSLGAGATHFAPATTSSLPSRTEFMWQVGGGALVRLWQSHDGAMSVALRPDLRVRWTHGWAHAPGNPVDPLYDLGLTLAF
jgi:hypothetical protein